MDENASRAEGPDDLTYLTFLRYFGDLDEAGPELKRQFDSSIAAGAALKAFQGRDSETIAYPWAPTAVGRARMAAQITAGAVLVTAFAIVEDVMIELGYPPKRWVAGAEFEGGTRFSTLLMAGSHSVRHSREWDRAWRKGFVRAIMAAPATVDEGPPIAYSKQQLDSIDPLITAVEGAISPSGSVGLIAHETLLTVSDGGSWETFRRRLYEIARSIAGDEPRLVRAHSRAVAVRKGGT